MMEPPALPPDPRKPRVRLALLALLIVGLAVSIVLAAVAPAPQVFLCDAFNADRTLHPCDGIDDTSSCDSLNASCVRSSCGRRLADKIDISAAGAADPLEPGAPIDVVHLAMIAWSLVPYILPACLTAAFLYAGDTFSLSCMALLVLLVILNEGVLKHLIAQPRPPGSCLYFTSTGMPSGHATTSVGVLVYLLLETWIERPALPRRRKIGITAALLVALGPVPFARVVLNDHYPSQVAVGSCIGAALGGMWFVWMLRYIQPRLGIPIARCSARLGLGLRNTYRVPEEPWALGGVCCGHDRTSSLVARAQALDSGEQLLASRE